MRLILLSIVLCLGTNSWAQVINTELLQHYTLDEIEDVLGTFGLPAGFLPLEYEVDYYKVQYMTLHPNGDSILVSGAMIVPYEVTCPLPLSSYQHGTVAAKSDVPSQLSDEGLLGVLYGSAGYVTVLPDYIGLGDSEVFHLYVHAESEANAALDLIRGAHALQEELGYSLNGQHFLWGYSQGGHATMALHRMMELDYPGEFEITASAPMSGPYDISGAQAEIITSDAVYPTPGYLPYVVLSYQEVYGNLYENLSEFFVAPYDELIPELFNGINGMGYINSQLPDVPNEIILPEILEAYESNPLHPIRLALEDNDVYEWVPQAKTRLYYCNGDDQVTYLNSVVALDYFEENDAPDVTGLDGGDYDHGGCASLAMLAGFNFFQTLVESPFDPEIEVQISPATAVGATDGEVLLVADGIDSWEISWNTGASGPLLTGVTGGFYLATITNEMGCSVQVPVTISIVVGLPEIDWAAVDLFPNPTADKIQVSGLVGVVQVSIYTSQGKLIEQIRSDASHPFDLGHLAQGLYVCELIVGDSRVVRRIQKL